MSETSTPHHTAGFKERRTIPSEVRLTDETVEYLEVRIAAAVESGIKGAINKETAAVFWRAGLAMFQEQASEHAGRFVLGGLWGLVRKVSLFFLLGGLVYAMGGWSALAGFFKIVFGR